MEFANTEIEELKKKDRKNKDKIKDLEVYSIQSPEVVSYQARETLENVTSHLL